MKYLGNSLRGLIRNPLKDDNNEKINYQLLQLTRQIPADPQSFYQDFGLLAHPRTGESVQD